MADIEDGLTTLGKRVERKARAVPPPRHAKPAALPRPDPAEPVTSTPTPAAAPVPDAIPSPPAPLVEPDETRTAAAPAPVEPAPPAGVQPTEREPKRAVTMQLRMSLAQRLEDLVVDLRRQHGVRASQVELVELVVSGLPTNPNPEFAARVRDFQARSPR